MVLILGQRDIIILFDQTRHGDTFGFGAHDNNNDNNTIKHDVYNLYHITLSHRFDTLFRPADLCRDFKSLFSTLAVFRIPGTEANSFSKNSFMYLYFINTTYNSVRFVFFILKTSSTFIKKASW